jgi:hypothetical protein
MTFFLYAICCFILPLWVFGGLYLAVEITDLLKKRYLKK